MGKITESRDEAYAEADKAIGAVKKELGKAFDDRELQVEGTVQETRGEVKERLAEAKSDFRKLGERSTGP